MKRTFKKLLLYKVSPLLEAYLDIYLCNPSDVHDCMHHLCQRVEILRLNSRQCETSWLTWHCMSVNT